MKALFIVLWIFAITFAIGWAALPFILAKVLGLGWISWFGILTVPSGITTVVVSILQAKLFFEE